MNYGDKKIAKIYRSIRYLFTIVPIVAGIDKFTNILTDWSIYLPETSASILPFPPNVMLSIVGIIEIVAGILYFANMKIGGYVISAWLILISLVLLISGQFYDVAVRDIVIALALLAVTAIRERIFFVARIN